MTPEQYCEQKAAPPGSAFYYSLHNLTEDQRDTVCALQAFYLELNEVVFECHDHSLAHTKLNWWRSEAAKLSLGKPDHPIMQVLQKNLEHFKLSPQKLVDIIDGIEKNLNPLAFNNFEEVTHHIFSTAGTRELLIADVTRKDNVISADAIYQLTLALELAHYIQHLHRYVRHDLILFSEDELNKFNVSRIMLHELKTTEEIRNLLQYQSEKAELAYKKVLADLKPEIRSILSSLIIRCEIAMTTLQEIKSSQFQVLENLISLTPLRSWWIALKTRFKLKLS